MQSSLPSTWLRPVVITRLCAWVASAVMASTDMSWTGSNTSNPNDSKRAANILAFDFNAH